MTVSIDHTLVSEGDSSSHHIFEGFEPITANFLYCPNQFFDVCLPNCSRGVVRIVAYVLRQMLGWVDEHGNPIHKNVTVSYDDLIQKAGVSNGAIGDAIDAAITLGFLSCIQEPKAHAQNQTAQKGTYEIRWDRTGSYVSDLSSFQGFYAGGGNFTPIPNQFFDQIITKEPLSVVKVVGSVIRHTVGYETKFGQRKQVAALPHSYLANYAKISMGKILNGAIKSALLKGYIQCVSQGVFDPRGREFGKAAEYAMKWRQAAVSIKNTTKRPAKQLASNHSKKTSDITPIRPLKEHSKKTSNRNTSSNNNNKIQDVVAVEFQDAFDLLLQVEFNGERFNKKTALKLAESRGLPEIKQQIAWLPKRNADRNPFGMLRSAIEQSWAAPIEIKERERNRHGAYKEHEKTTQEHADDEQVKRSKHERRRRRKEIEPTWDNLPNEEQLNIEKSAFQRLNSDFERKRFHTNDEYRRDACLDELSIHKTGLISYSS